MNFDYKIQAAMEKAEAAVRNIQDLKSEYEDARDFTAVFLDICRRREIELVSVGKRTELIEPSASFPFGVGGSAFAISKTGNRTAIWEACGEAGVYAGCGNSCQAQLNQKGAAQLIDGVYRLQDGVWERVE